MSKHDHRVQRVVVLDMNDKSLYEESFTDEYKGQLILSKHELSEQEINNFIINEDEDPYQNRIFIIDPLGNLMMSYEAGAEPSGIIKDLKLLIKASRIG